LQATSAKVPNVYQQNYRPARWSELKALIDGNPNNINQIVSQLGGDLGTVYNVSSQGWLTATLAASPNPSSNFNSSVPVDGGVYAVASRTCNPTSSFPVNVPDVYGDFNVTDNVIDACFCFSTVCASSHSPESCRLQ
jgi:hypothetical protein